MRETTQHETMVVLMGGPLTAGPRLTALLAGNRAVAADGGMRHAPLLSTLPELWVGDFDSSADELIARYPQVHREPYPPAKNETDGEIATEAAIARGATRLVLAGALGGERSDHALLHLLLGLSLAERGIEAVLTSGEEEAYPLLPGTRALDLPKGSLFSILGFTALDGLTISGARYPLEDFALPFGSSRTISNVAEGPVHITLERGRAILLARPYDMTGA
ncbi:thiamine diphosphokinase [Xaviernesmea oryzae]|uniref:Thiamine diphosphokinase n=1 Tax=Xaviernesmea oryzae TaxID=464029 RepID=A0A1Q9AXM8_9HYPH|nr:thiamine diphosphokinase [Xaviernesmea oryzae]OLP60181.1 thiamine diphosphokinase [Xaviernesmea oryzae]SEK29878.1 thiamine pyrophosphokinase [Xaviernesmea oryzae]